MFRNQFVASLKVSGQILREDRETVRLPFGSEYSLLLKNLSGKRAVVRVEIDGQDALDGRRLVVNANSSLDLERFSHNDNRQCGQRFKFIQKTERIQQHRGDRADDGIVRISWQYEKPTPVIDWAWYQMEKAKPWCPSPNQPWWEINKTVCGDTTGTYTTSGTTFTHLALNMATCRGIGDTGTLAQTIPVAAAAPKAEEGITVGGSISMQTFGTTYVGALETETYTICLKLLGESPVTGQAIEKPVTVREKVLCQTCGESNSSKHKFCSQCGTGLGD